MTGSTTDLGKTTGPQPRRERFTALVVALALGTACNQAAEATYTVELVGPPNAFAGATSVSLLLRDREVAKAAVPTTGGFSLEVAGLDPTVERSTIFTVRALSADNRIVAFGQSPQIEVFPQEHLLRVFVQPPGTFARSQDLATKLINGFVVTADVFAQSSAGLPMTVPLFGLGRTEAGGLSSLLYVYDPITHRVQEIGRTRFGRADVTAVARPLEGIVTLFGGIGTAIVAEGEKTNSQLEFFAPSRVNFSVFQNLQTSAINADPMHARARAVVALAVQKRLYIGGVNEAGAPLNTVMSFDESVGGSSLTAAYTPMAAARVDHTATDDPTSVITPESTDSSGRVLVYGGNSDGPVAEVLIVRTAEWRPAMLPAGPTGTARSKHQALRLTSAADAKINQVLILGGSDNADTARADSVLCTPSTLTCEPGPITLRTPRKNFTLFVVRNDLVISGGLGADGQPVGKAEIYDATTLAFVAEIDAVPRASASASTLPNASTVILGGLGVGNAPSTAVEIYQPRRTL